MILINKHPAQTNKQTNRTQRKKEVSRCLNCVMAKNHTAKCNSAQWPRYSCIRLVNGNKQCYLDN